MNAELAEHISVLAAPIYAALIATSPPERVNDDEWRAMARIGAIGMARELWKATLDTDA